MRRRVKRLAVRWEEEMGKKKVKRRVARKIKEVGNEEDKEVDN